MSLREALRSRFASRSALKESTSNEGVSKCTEDKTDLTNSEEEGFDMQPSSSRPGKEVLDADLLKMSPGRASLSDSFSTVVIGNDSEKGIYEQQLMQLQEQLVASMIENQNLSSELQDFKDRNKVAEIEKDLDFERQRNLILSQELQRVSENKRGSSSSRDMSWVDVAQEVTEESDIAKEEDLAMARKGPLGRSLHWLLSGFYELVADFTEDAPPEIGVDKHSEQLTVKRLKENIKRAKDGTKPIFSTVRGVHAMLTWRNPTLTFLVFAVYMYAAWHGWLLPVVLFLVIMRLAVNCLKHKGWNINISYFAEVEDTNTKDKEGSKESALSDKFNLVLEVATKVQNGLGEAADGLEKVKNLLMWEQPDASLQLLLTCTMGFVLSCFLKGTTLFTMLAMYLGFKMFLLEYIYNRFPRFKQRHDSVYRIWRQLPTDIDLQKRYHRAAIDRHLLAASDTSASVAESPRDAFSVSDLDRSFCDTFNLPYSETPLVGWVSGRRCTCIDKDKSLTSAFKNGRLYLTNSFLCFERQKNPSPQNMMIPLADITSITKVKPFTWIPGSGMSIEVAVTGSEKPYVFGAMLSRDDTFKSLMNQGRLRGLAWAGQQGQGQDGSCSESEAANGEAEESTRQRSRHQSDSSLGKLRMSDLKEADDLDLEVFDSFT